MVTTVLPAIIVALMVAVAVNGQVTSAPSVGHTISVVNRCAYKIWPGIASNHGRVQPLGGGFELAAGTVQNFTVPAGWAGAIWGRTGCDDQGKCDTGTCVPHRIGCGGATPAASLPVTMAHFSLDGLNGGDQYEVSVVNGFNLPVQVRPLAGTYVSRTGTQEECQLAGCANNLLVTCPPELSVRDESDTNTIACRSACQHSHDERFCCTGSHARPINCNPSEDNYLKLFRTACATAVNYLYDHSVPTYQCQGADVPVAAPLVTGYQVQFCL